VVPYRAWQQPAAKPVITTKSSNDGSWGAYTGKYSWGFEPSSDENGKRKTAIYIFIYIGTFIRGIEWRRSSRERWENSNSLTKLLDKLS